MVITTREYQLMWQVPVIAACFIRNLKYIAVLSLIGTVLVLTGLVIVFQYIVRPPNLYGNVDYWFMSFERLLLFLGAVLYSFEGQAMLLPLENEMKTPRDMIRPLGVLHCAMALVIICYIACGFFGYLKFGTGVEGSITLNLPNETLYQIVILIFMLVIFVGAPLQFYVIFAMIWPELKQRLPLRISSSKFGTVLAEAGFRTMVILIAFTFAIAIPNLSNIIPLIGITAGSTIALILPPIIHTLTMWQEWLSTVNSAKLIGLLMKNLLIASFGIFGLVAGLYATVLQLTGGYSLHQK